jgi:hypothetical protein
MPESGVAIIDDKTELDSPIDKNNFGYCFYSKYLSKVALLNENIIDCISNQDSFEKIILFNHLIYNKDRNKGNLLISTGKGDKMLFAIDHTHVFKTQTIWDRFSLKHGIEESDFRDKIIMEYNSCYDFFFTNKDINFKTLKSVANNFQELITSNLLNEIINDIPKDWYVSQENLDALKCYLLYRASHLNDICEVILNYRIGGKPYV